MNPISRPSNDPAAANSLERSDLAPDLRERLYDLRAELAPLRKVLRDAIG